MKMVTGAGLGDLTDDNICKPEHRVMKNTAFVKKLPDYIDRYAISVAIGLHKSLVRHIVFPEHTIEIDHAFETDIADLASSSVLGDRKQRYHAAVREEAFADRVAKLGVHVSKRQFDKFQMGPDKFEFVRRQHGQKPVADLQIHVCRIVHIAHLMLKGRQHLNLNFRVQSFCTTKRESRKV